ncbi:PREDICTED: protein HAIKU1-like [Camelina sativa]|uniref:Protein HAIKU1-like n=1 Tax=Camelina sativa TaxID=90675 RepID=A0ABM0VU26_CAMSA|nr:PREDICTED: protein HAIKU1-like [Camelina sativa]
MDRSWNNDQLGVNKIGKNIKKIPLHQPDFSYGIGIASARPQPRPQVYNIVGENDFRSVVVQQLTPSRDNLAHPQQNTPFRKIRPPALTHDPPRVAAQPTHELLVRPPMQPYMHHGEQLLSKTVESPVSVYMHCLQSSLGDSGPIGNQMQSSHEYQPHSQWKSQAQPHQPPQSHNHHSPRFSGAARDKPILPTPPRFNSPPQQIYNNSLHTPSPRFNGRGILPTPTRGSTFSSMGQPGILGPGSNRQHPASSGLVFPSSPYGLFPNSSPRYR